MEDYPTGWTAAFVWRLVFWFVGWTALFYVLVFTAPLWFDRFPQSSKKHENVKYWNVAQITSFIHACLVTALSVPALIELSLSPSAAKFPPMEGEQPTCSIPAGHDYFAPFADIYHALGLSGIAFTTHIVSDIFTSLLHGLATPSMVVHHIAFVVAGAIIRGHCMLPFNSAALMAMEASTPFLNFMMVFRNRGDAYASLVRISGYTFLVLFVIVRLGMNTYGVAIMWINHATIAPPSIATWQIRFVLVAVTVGALVQYFFFVQVVKNLMKPRRTTAAEHQTRLVDDGNLGEPSVERNLSSSILPDGQSGYL
eukprot:TRINITY_DN48726_c0_g1_i1.p1 TRINITY_DN48726_c0_g1~~TRINITY_DN48726_c0_g1_i1.p1  ORF type:complete len:311 (-),score=19.50 TRINITY_DN48726_c0_g1_i1:63-995(-)